MADRSTPRVIVVAVLVGLGAAAIAQSGPESSPPVPATQPATQPAPRGAGAAAPRFDPSGSDAKAIEVADRVMERLGGQQAWDETRFLSWNFFGRRLSLWDKHSNTIRVELDRGPVGSIVVVMNTVDRTGLVWKNGEPITDPYPKSQMFDAAISAWFNDAYWIFMPYKLKDGGVSLRYLGVRQMADGRPGEALEVTFDGVGNTPENKYHVYVGVDTGLVEQWDFFKTRDQEAPTLSTPWLNWKRHGRIMLSDDRGNGRVHTRIGAWDALPETAFTSPDPVNLEQATPAKGD